MPSRQQPHSTQPGPDSYRSASCRIGTHHACAESSPATAPVDVPVIYETCDCSCHTIAKCSVPAEAAR
ncbi:hypothetical protein KBY55_26795 [Streptomyces sp. b94]|uniref:hypothetical protein n=1 Tax=Streptomyces sp. b94 TaxID=1827634 RepID=UPI001B37D9C7|nr:hypothetical protein [Streptomyces sp. b94]MBQ1099571.1 hypothetical protein [Streptomyces sp. b94]